MYYEKITSYLKNLSDFDFLLNLKNVFIASLHETSEYSSFNLFLNYQKSLKNRMDVMSNILYIHLHDLSQNFPNFFSIGYIFITKSIKIIWNYFLKNFISNSVESCVFLRYLYIYLL